MYERNDENTKLTKYAELPFMRKEDYRSHQNIPESLKGHENRSQQKKQPFDDEPTEVSPANKIV